MDLDIGSNISIFLYGTVLLHNYYNIITLLVGEKLCRVI